MAQPNPDRTLKPAGERAIPGATVALVVITIRAKVISAYRRKARCANFLAMLSGLSVVLASAAIGQAYADDTERMRLAVDQLVRSQLPSGLFPYDFNFLTGSGTDTTNMTSPNLVRQTGTAYVLAAYHARLTDTALRRTIEAAIEGFGRLSLPITRTAAQHMIQKTRILSLSFGRRTKQRVFNWLGMLYSPEGDGKMVSPDGAYESAWLGGTALALLTELEYRRGTGDNRYAGLRAAWLRGILSLKLPGGGFRAAPHYIGEEHYFNGEGWLALAVYADMFREDRATAAVLTQLDDYLLNRYSQRWNQQFYSWGTMAAEVRYATTGDQRFLRFIESQASDFLARLEKKPKDESRLNCAKLEGLAAAARVLESHSPRDRPLIQQLRSRIDPAMAENRKLQIQPGQDRIVFADGTYLRSAQLQGYAGAFHGGPFDPAIRIDHTIHCLSAMMILDRATSPR